MKTLWALLLSVLFAPVPAWAQMNVLPTKPHLMVKGQSERMVVPDRFTVTLDLQETDADNAVALHKLQDSSNTVMAAFEKNNLLSGSVKASSPSVSSRYATRNGQNEFKGTQVRRQIQGTFVSLKDAQSFLMQIKTGPELQIVSLLPGYAGEQALRNQLKHEAGEKTRQTAGEIAETYGIRIKGLYSISDIMPNFAYGIQTNVVPDPPSQQKEPKAGETNPVSLPVAQLALNPATDTGETQEGQPSTQDAQATEVQMEKVAARETAPPIRPQVLKDGNLTFSEKVYAIFLIDP